MSSWLRPVEDALGASPDPRVFFRDDDAGWDDARLLALLDAFAGYVLDVAVIPAALHPSLTAELRDRAGATLHLHQHGFAHVDHEHEGRRCEFGAARTPAEQRSDLEAGRQRLAELLGETDPVFTPPWNRCTRATAEAVARLGFAVLSRESRAEPFRIPGLAEVPVHVDWVRLDRAALAARLAAAIASGRPAGVMLHHAEMDARDRRDSSTLAALVDDWGASRALVVAAD